MNETFYDWLMKFNIDELIHPFKDLATEVKQDKSFPKTSNPQILYQYMDENFSHYLAIKTFKNALILYLLESDKGILNIELGTIQWFDIENPFIDLDEEVY